MKRIKILLLFLLLFCLAAPMPAQAATVTLPAYLKTIEADAFRNASSLDYVVIPEGTTYIGARAFAGSSATEIVLPDSLEFIAQNAFDDCVALKLSVTEGSYAYKWCIENNMPYTLTADTDNYYITLKLSNVFQPSEWNYKASQKFADMVTERTKGHITVTYYGQNELDCYADSVTQAVKGSLWIGLEDPLMFADYVGDCAALAGPMLYNSDAEYNYVMTSDIVADIKAQLARENIHILDTHYTYGFRSVFTNYNINKPEDLKGVKLRSTGSTLFTMTVQCLGATAVNMSFTECLSAIPLGIVEGFEGSTSTLVGAGAPYELVKKVALTRHLLASRWMFMPENVYQSIPKKWRDILDACAVECGKWEQEMVAQEEAEQIASLKAKRVTFNEVDLDAFTKACAPVREWLSDEYGADPNLSEEIIRLVQNYRNSN